MPELDDKILDELLLEVEEPVYQQQIRPNKPKRRKVEIEIPVERVISPEVQLEVEAEKQPSVEFIEGLEYKEFYWYDCCEDSKFPGVVFLFGRTVDKSTKLFVSCCVIVQGVSKSTYLLINKNSTYDDAASEFSNIYAKQLKISNFTCEKVVKKYAFSEDSSVPHIGDYVLIKHSASQPSIPSGLKGQTFSAVLNSNQSCLESFILESNLKGPCWLKIYDSTPSNSHMTWTQVEVSIDSPSKIQIHDDVEVKKPPYLCALSLAVRSYTNPRSKQIEILSICAMTNNTFYMEECLKRTNKASGHFCIMAKQPEYNKEMRLPYDFDQVAKRYNKTKLSVVDSERDLLIEFMKKFHSLDPDIVVGHDLLNFELETLVLRMKVLKVGEWSKLGRFKRTELPQTKAGVKSMFSGRIMCDTRTSSMEMIRARSYDLTELTKQVLDKDRVVINPSEIASCYKNSDDLIKLISTNWEDVDSIFSIFVELNIIPLAFKITKIAGNTLGRTLLAGRSERNEYLLLHAFHEQNFICPEKTYQKNPNKLKSNNMLEDVEEYQPTRKKAAYSGGLVLDPKVGYYDNYIMLLDFNSLYPSIIQEFNICFSTVAIPKLDDGIPNPNVEIMATVPEPGIETGVLPNQLKNLVARRREVKKLMSTTKQPDRLMMLDIEQKALKLTANSMYGCLGFSYSRFYAKHLASLVTFKGREILMNTRKLVEKLGYEVIYGDTDSLMIHTKLVDYDEVIQKGTSIKEAVNGTFKLLEIDIDGVYKPLLLLKKKNYAGMMIKKLQDGSFKTTLETKGLDTVRRDRAVIAKEAGEQVLKELLNGGKEIGEIINDIHNYLKNLSEEIKAGRIDKKKFLISKQLNRNPDEYRDTKGLGHVVLAKRFNGDERNTKKLKSGDTIEYVICTDGTKESANQRAYTLRELDEISDLQLDIEYYLCQQIHPVMVRILGNIPSTNPYILAEMLGVEKSSLIHIPKVESISAQLDQLASKGVSRFNSCKPLIIKCPNCLLDLHVTSRTRKSKIDKKEVMSLEVCDECAFKCALRPKKVVFSVIKEIRRLTKEFYNCKYICDNSDCAFESRNVVGNYGQSESSLSNEGQLLCEKCSSSMYPKISDKEHCLQLRFLSHLLDIEKEQSSSKSLDNEGDSKQIQHNLVDMYKMCKQEVDYALKCCLVNTIDLKALFEPFTIMRKMSEKKI